MSIRLPVASYNQPSRVPARLVNVYAAQTPGKQPVELLGAPGIMLFAALGGIGRGLHVMKSQLYAVAGSILYRVPENGGAYPVGTMPGAERLMMASGPANGSQIITDTGYLYDGATVDQITDADKSSWAAIAHIDTYLVAIEAGTNKFISSDTNDGSSYDALSFHAATAYSDNLVALAADHNQAILVGTESTEIMWLSGASGMPFERLAGGVYPLGGVSRFGICNADNTVFIVASDRTARSLRGNTWVRVSQHAVEEAWAGYESVSDAQCFSFTWNGHVFVVFRFISAGACWVLDVTTGEWSERESYGSTGWDVCAAATCYGKVWVQHEDGRLGYLSDGVATEFGDRMVRSVTFPSTYDQGRRIAHSEFEAAFRTGDVDAGGIPYVDLEYSDDGGNVWHFAPRRELGRTGEYRKVVRWTRLGQARERVYRLSVADPVPFQLLDAKLVAA